jgi:hypothetical protein
VNLTLQNIAWFEYRKPVYVSYPWIFKTPPPLKKHEHFVQNGGQLAGSLPFFSRFSCTMTGNKWERNRRREGSW